MLAARVGFVVLLCLEARLRVSGPSFKLRFGLEPHDLDHVFARLPPEYQDGSHVDLGG